MFYKVQLTQDLKLADQRRVFADWVVEMHENDPDLDISRRGDHNWPPRFCDSTPCDLFLCGYVKEKVYANSPASIQDLKDDIREASRT